MSIRKRNEFLDDGDSDAELENGSESEAEEGRAAIGSRAIKRRKVNSGSEASGDDEAQEESRGLDSRFDFGKLDDADNETADNEDAGDDGAATRPVKAKKSSTMKQVEAAAKAVRNSGVIYISRVPPFMKPHTLKHFLEPWASKGLGRVFLTPEDHVAHARRVKSGGNKKKSFTDGWVEFNSKKEAQIAAETLNGNIIGGKKGNFYHDDLWNMKYLKGFKWNHLTEQISNENAERAARTRDEIRRTRKENKAFVEDVERAKMLEGIEIKKKAKMEREGGVATTTAPVKEKKFTREFKQRKAQSNSAKDGDGKTPTSNALKMIF
ncbi:related to Pre-rRNA-processing protein ESF2 [Ramularia collo-cygni]|uniref:18S rRNA factor 2 n=1 Tax=Ramularia collo-cygni TaxID=112498 RepID=A0A2D3VN68_9PEZI|nr:related to Pre-rRNA-processing protein ESF2 [Ramularia collo-cygni]CZT24314.1 related to Pre-rRNA-processing protein ESF2 [Ramularia collo-cygni]